MSDDDTRPANKTIHRRFALALLAEGLAGAGKVHLDHRVEVERETIHGWAPRRSANDPAPLPPPPPDPHRRLAQGIVAAVMTAAGSIPLSVEVGGEPDFIDLYFEPEQAGVPAPGLLGRMTRTCAILSPYHLPPEDFEVRGEMLHALRLNAAWSREAKAKGDDEDVDRMPETWIVAPTISAAVVRAIGVADGDGWPAGTYHSARGFALHLVSLRELPVTRDTLLLRLLQTGERLEEALAEVEALPGDAPERRATRAALLAASPDARPVPIGDAAKDAVLRACRQTYRRWAACLSR